MAIEAGLGTLGLELNLLVPEFGPRCYTTVILTTAELEPDGKMTAQLCIGESCSRCLYACPADAVLHWGIDKRACATAAQEFGYATLLKLFTRFIESQDGEERIRLLRGHGWYGIWQGLLRVVGAFGDCPRCLAVCPVGYDYKLLMDMQKVIPEKTEEKVKKARDWQRARKEGQEVEGLSGHRLHFIGEEGYIPPRKRRDGADRHGS